MGEVLGMVIATALAWGNTASIAISVVLAFVFGYALTIGPILRAGVPYRRAVALAGASDTISIATMEAIDNAFLLVVPGALAAGLWDRFFWWSLALSLAVAFAITVPVNRWLHLSRQRACGRPPQPLGQLQSGRPDLKRGPIRAHLSVSRHGPWPAIFAALTRAAPPAHARSCARARRSSASG